MSEQNGNFGSLEDLNSALGIQGEPTPEPTPPNGGDPAPEPTPDPTPEPTPAPEPTPQTELSGGDPAPEPNETSFDINDFNKWLGTDYADQDSIKKVIEASRQTEELQTKLSELETAKKKFEDENLLLRENLDPMKYFSSEDDYKIAQFKKQFPDKDPSVAYTVFTTDASKLSDKDALILEKMLDNPGLTREDVSAVVEHDYGIEEGEEQERHMKAKMTIDANKARQNFSSLKGNIKLPDKVDVDALAQQQKDLQIERGKQLTEGWKNVSGEISKNLGDIEIKDEVDGKEVSLFNYSITKDFPQEITDQVADNMAKLGIEMNQENAKVAADYMKQAYVSQNIEKIIKSAMDHVKAQAEEARLNKQHNPGTRTPDGKPDSNGSDHNDKIMAGLNKGWQPTKFL